MWLTIVGCGDAFGSGGRLQTSFHVAMPETEFLIDCGATSLIGMSRFGLDPNRVSTIFISHLHGDHFAGLVWWLIHAQHVARRTAPLTVTGPAGIEERFGVAVEALFPGALTKDRRYKLDFVEYREREPLTIGPVKVTPFEVLHPSGAPPYALRFETGGRVLSFSGDTEWVDNLVPAAKGADLFIAECYGFERETRFHMHWRTIEAKLDQLGAKRVMLTHMSETMLANRAAVNDRRVVLAEDGLVLQL